MSGFGMKGDILYLLKEMKRRECLRKHFITRLKKFAGIANSLVGDARELQQSE